MCVDDKSGDVQPLPPRYWWLKRIAVAFGVLIAALLGLRIWWGAVANRRLQAEIARIQAAGEPIWPEDFDSEPVPEEDNAVTLLLEAATLLTQPVGVSLTAGDILKNPDIIDEHLDEARSFIEANAPALELVRAARGKAGVDWEIRIRSPVINFIIQPLSGQRGLAKFLYAAATYHHKIDDDGAAIETLRDALALSAVLDHRPGLTAHSMAMAIDAIMFNAILELSPFLDVGTTEGESSGRGATQDQIASLMNDLMDDAGYREAAVTASHFGRMIMLDDVMTCVRGQATWPMIAAGAGSPSPSLAARVLTWPISPVYELDAVWMIRWNAEWAIAAAEHDYPRFLAKAPDEDALFVDPVTRLTRPLARVLLPSLSRAYLLHFVVLANRRMAATSLAIRLYEVDHGRRPEELNDLVPEYLASIPLDPFASDGRTIAYKPEADPPILYSVGKNGVDEGGTVTRPKNGRISRADRADVVFYLDGNPRRNE